MFDAFVKYVVAEFGVITQAPVTFLLCLVVTVAVIWRALSWRYAGTIDSLEGRNRLQADQIADYKNKLSGATPDEARERLDALDAQVRSLSSTVTPAPLPVRNPDGIYQQGRCVGTVQGAIKQESSGLVFFTLLNGNGSFNENATFEYHDFLLKVAGFDTRSVSRGIFEADRFTNARCQIVGRT